jgi:hypothetical protein
MRTLATTMGVLALGAGTVLAADAPSGSARQALDRIKTLVGTWEGNIGAPDGPKGSVRYELTGGGHIVKETLFPETDHEMLTIYHLDGETLLATHYCSSGNAPLMKLEKATPQELSFGFSGGANLDPAKDVHIHSGRLRWADGGGLQSEWDDYKGAQHQMTHKFFLSRKP